MGRAFLPGRSEGIADVSRDRFQQTAELVGGELPRRTIGQVDQLQHLALASHRKIELVVQPLPQALRSLCCLRIFR